MSSHHKEKSKIIRSLLISIKVGKSKGEGEEKLNNQNPSG